MKKRIQLKSVIAVVCLSVIIATPATYASEIVSAENPEAILNIAKGFGSATLKKDSAGDPFIVGRIDGTKYGIVFYGCNNGKECDEIQFSAGWSGANASLDDINKWNSKKKYGKAYLDRDGDPRLDMMVNLDYGVTEKNLDDSFNWWTKVLGGFKKEILGQ